MSFWNSERVIPPEMVLGSATRDSAMGGHIIMSYSNQITRCSRAVAWARRLLHAGSHQQIGQVSTGNALEWEKLARARE